MASRTMIGWLTLMLVVLLSGCGDLQEIAKQESTPTSQPAAPASAPAPAARADTLYVRDGFGSDAQRLAIVGSNTGGPARELPLGAVSSDWSRLYVAQSNGISTTVSVLDMGTGLPVQAQTIEGRYDLPEVSLDGSRGGLSPDGRWLALQREPRQEGTSWRSHLVVVPTSMAEPAKRIDLDGIFWFDALSRSGESLYLVEYAAPGDNQRYQIRRYDLLASQLDPQVVVTKGEEDEDMRGIRHSAVTSPDGVWQYTLYLNEEHGSFIHALNMADKFAVCIDLPKAGQADWDRQLFWSLVQSSDGAHLYAANGALGVVAEIDLKDFKVGRSANVAPPQSGAGPLEQLGSWLVPTAHAKRLLLGASVLSADGKTLFAIAERGVLAISTGDLKLVGRMLEDMQLDSIALSPDSTRIYAVSTEQHTLVQVDATSGKLIGPVRGVRSPWGVLRVG